MRRNGSGWLYRWGREHWAAITAGIERVWTVPCFRWRFSAWRNTCGNEATPPSWGISSSSACWADEGRHSDRDVVTLRSCSMARSCRDCSNSLDIFLRPVARKHVSFFFGEWRFLHYFRLTQQKLIRRFLSHFKWSLCFLVSDKGRSRKALWIVWSK